MGFTNIIGAIGGIAGKLLGSFTMVPQILSIVETISQIIGKAKMDGTAKHDLAIALIKQAIVTSEGFSGREILDQDLFGKGLDQVVHGMVDCLNATGKGWGDILNK